MCNGRKHCPFELGNEVVGNLKRNVASDGSTFQISPQKNSALYEGSSS